MVWVNIPDTDVDQDSPVTVELMTALRDNPTAIANGDSGAPRITDHALSTAVAGVGVDWVRARTAPAGVGTLGTYGLFIQNNPAGADRPPGTAVAGSTLAYTTATGFNLNVRPSGTWRVMGFLSGAPGADALRVTVFLRAL